MYERVVLIEVSKKVIKDALGYLIDVGAHFGENSLPFALMGWQVISFEPEPNNFTILMERLSKFNNVTCVPVIVSDQFSASLQLFISDKHSGIHSLRPFHNTHSSRIVVKNTRLDVYLKEFVIPKVDLLKIDVEGADFLVLKGMDWINFHPFLVLAEFMDERTVPNYGYTYHEMVEFMQDRNYGCYVFNYRMFYEYGSKMHTNVPRLINVSLYDKSKRAIWGNLLFYRRDIEEIVGETISRLRSENVLKKMIRYPSYYFGFIPEPIKQFIITLRDRFLVYRHTML